LNLEDAKRIDYLEKSWNELAIRDPLWAILIWPEKYGNKWKVDEFFANGDIEIREVMRHIQSVHQDVGLKKALDFGCGVGRLSQALGHYFQEVTGVDISEQMIELAKKYAEAGVRRCTYVVNKAPDLKIFKDETFDFVYSNITLQHMDKELCRRYIGEFLRVVSRKGIVIFQLPSHRAWTLQGQILRLLPYKIYRKLRYPNFPFVPMNSIGKEEVVHLLTKSGGKVLHVEPDQNGGPHQISFRYCVKKT
jgi:SAM-dependent methyltransferase